MVTARDTMRRLFKEGVELQQRTHTQEEENTLRAKAPKIIEAACREQHQENGSVFSPNYCLICDGCPLGAIAKGVAGVR